jgi:hypothetical protein
MKRLRFFLYLFGMVRIFFFGFGYFATAEPRPAAELYTHFGGEARTGYQGGYMVGGNEKKEGAAGRAYAANGPAGNPAFSHPFRQRSPMPPGGAGTDRPGGGIHRLIAQFWRRTALQGI